MTQNEKILQTAVLLDNLLTRVFMHGSPGEWVAEKTTAIEVKIPVPADVIAALELTRSKFNDNKVKELVDFNELLSLYIADLVYIGLSHKVQKLTEDTKQ